MNLLTCDSPIAVCEVDGELFFDSEITIVPDKTYDIACDYRSILDIMQMFQNKKYIVQEQFWIALRIFYLDNLPDDKDEALIMMNRFIDCDTEWKDSKTPIRTYDWEQDGTAIYTGINKTNGNVLRLNPNLHWWEFVGCFMDMTGECQFNDITSNRIAHKKGKATKEQKEARKLYPDIYILRENQRPDNETANRAKELERLMNS